MYGSEKNKENIGLSEKKGSDAVGWHCFPFFQFRRSCEEFNKKGNKKYCEGKRKRI